MSKDENMHSLILRKDVLHPATFSSSAAFLSSALFSSPAPLLACVFCLQSFERSERAIGTGTFGVRVWICVAVCGNTLRGCERKGKDVQQLQWHVAGISVQSQIWSHRLRYAARNYGRFLSGSVRILRFIEMGCRKGGTDSAGLIGVNLFPSLLFV